jgi:hypothetical protein
MISTGKYYTADEGHTKDYQIESSCEYILAWEK